MNDSTNIRIIADNIRKLNSRTSKLEKAAAKIPKDYSSASEVNTGQKWIDEKDIYSKVISGTFPAITQAIDVELGTVSDIDTLVNTWLIVKRTNNEVLDLSNYAVKLNTGVFSLGNVNTPYSQSEYNLTVFYTKLDPVPSETLTKKKTTKKG